MKTLSFLSFLSWKMDRVSVCPPTMHHRHALYDSGRFTDRRWLCTTSKGYTGSARQPVWGLQRLYVLSLLVQGNWTLRCHTDSASIFTRSVAFTTSPGVCHNYSLASCFRNFMVQIAWGPLCFSKPNSEQNTSALLILSKSLGIVVSLPSLDDWSLATIFETGSWGE